MKQGFKSLPIIALLFAGPTFAAPSVTVRDVLKQSPDWFRSAEGREVLAKRCDTVKIEAVRRNGYAWHGAWGDRVLKQFEGWNNRWDWPRLDQQQ